MLKIHVHLCILVSPFAFQILESILCEDMVKSKRCGWCSDPVYVCRISRGEGWKLEKPARFFCKLVCLVSYALAADDGIRSQAAAAISPYIGTTGTRGVYEAAMQQLLDVDASGSTQPATAMNPIVFDSVSLQLFWRMSMLLFLQFCLRAGPVLKLVRGQVALPDVRTFQRWQNKVLELCPAGFRTRFLYAPHNMWWAMLDSTSLYIIANWIAPKTMPPDVFLANLVVALVCLNSKRVLSAMGGFGSLTEFTALNFYRKHADVNQKLLVAGKPVLPQSPAGGMTGVTRHALYSLAKTLGVMQSTGKNSDHFMFLLFGTFVEFVAQNASQAWKELMAAKKLSTQVQRNEKTLAVLSERFGLRNLGAAHAARFLEVWQNRNEPTQTRIYDACSCTVVGSQAGEGLGLLTGDASGHNRVLDVKGLLLKLVSQSPGSLVSQVRQDLGARAAQFLETSKIPGLKTHSRYQLHEHLACEFVKLNTDGRGSWVSATSDEEYQKLLKKSLSCL